MSGGTSRPEPKPPIKPTDRVAAKDKPKGEKK